MTKRQILSERANRMRKQMTKEERKLWFEFLANYPINFVNQKVIGNYIVDFYSKKVHLSIELDGSQHYTDPYKAYDLARTSYLSTLGIKELRFANSDIWNNFDGVCEQIHNEVQRRRNDQVNLPLSRLKEKK